MPDGERLDTPGGEGSFLVSYDGIANAVALSDFMAATLVGDYNQDGNVDAADYVLWRKTPNNFGGDPDGYVTWRANFGQPPGSNSNANADAAVPEPVTLLLLMFVAAGWCLRRGRAA